MDDIARVVEEIFLDAGFPEESISHGSRVQLPGYYRAEKKWDLVVIYEDTVAAAIEFKSQVGSFGNNANNRIAEVIGDAADLWRAYHAGLMGDAAPWIGYLLLLEASPQTTRPVRVKQPFYGVDDAFSQASYQERYELCCRRMLEDGLYNGVCFVTAVDEPGAPIKEPADDLSFAAFTEAIQARAHELLGDVPRHRRRRRGRLFD